VVKRGLKRKKKKREWPGVEVRGGDDDGDILIILALEILILPQKSRGQRSGKNKRVEKKKISRKGEGREEKTEVMLEDETK